MSKPTRIQALESELNRIWRRIHGIPPLPSDELTELHKEYSAKYAEWVSLVAQRARIQTPANRIGGPL